MWLLFTNTMERKRKALIVFFNPQKEVLLQDRRGISKMGEEWGFFGGGIEGDETPQQAVVRETKEELTYDLKEMQFLGEFTDALSDRIIERHMFIAPIENSTSFILKEGKGMAWFSVEEAMKLRMVSAGDFAVLEKLKMVL